MRKIKYLLFILPFLFVSNVFAQDFNVSTTDITSPSSSGTGKYTGLEIYNSGTSNVYNIGTRYNGQLSRIIFNLIAGGYADANGFEKGHTYTLTMNMATDDWRNKFGSVSVKCEGSSGQELSNGRVTYISYRKIKFSFTAPSSTWCQFVYVDLKSTNVSTTAFTGVSNWNLSSMVISDPAYSSSGGSGGSNPTPTPTPLPNNQEIINNNNQNTQNIINNNNQNTQDVIENNNSNTDKIVETIEKKCSNLLNIKTYSLASGIDTNTLVVSENGITITGTTNATSSNYLAYYLSVTPNTDYHLSVENNNNTFIVFTTNYTTIARAYSGTTSLSFNSGNNETLYFLFYAKGTTATTYNKIMLSKDNSPFCVFGSSSNRLDDLNDNLTNDNIENGTGTDFFSNFTDEDFGLSSIITIPLLTIQSLSSSSCISLNLPIPFTNDTLTLPCMSQIYDSYAHDIFVLWQIVSFGIISYYICIDIFKMVKGFKDPESDKVEVLDL